MIRSENFGQILLEKMTHKLITENQYELTRCFQSIDDLKSMLFADILNASLDSFNSLNLHSVIDIEHILMDNNKALYNKHFLTNRSESQLIFCEMFYELNSIVKCNDFKLLFTDCFREYIQFWLNDLLFVDILKNAPYNKEQQKLRYLNIMNSIIANFDKLIKYKCDVQNGDIQKLKSETQQRPPNEFDLLSWSCVKLCDFVNQFHGMLANQMSKLQIDGKQICEFDYFDILAVTQLHEYYLPFHVWQNIAFQLGLPCVTNKKFIKRKFKKRRRLEERQKNILTNIDRMTERIKVESKIFLNVSRMIIDFCVYLVVGSADDAKEGDIGYAVYATGR